MAQQLKVSPGSHNNLLLSGKVRALVLTKGKNS